MIKLEREEEKACCPQIKEKGKMYTRYSKCYRKESMLQVNFNFCVDVYVLRKRGRGREREREHQREADIDFEIFKIALFKFKDIAMGGFPAGYQIGD